jgi:hypothetical protein
MVPSHPLMDDGVPEIVVIKTHFICFAHLSYETKEAA